jgi:hypothetical protein
MARLFAVSGELTELIEAIEPVPGTTAVTKSPDAAKQEFKTRYKEIKQMGVRPF